MIGGLGLGFGVEGLRDRPPVLPLRPPCGVGVVGGLGFSGLGFKV